MIYERPMIDDTVDLEAELQPPVLYSVRKCPLSTDVCQA
jgi:hypothetical protein